MRTVAVAVPAAEAVVGALEMAAVTAQVAPGQAIRPQPLATAERPQRPQHPATTARPRHRRHRQATQWPPPITGTMVIMASPP